MTQVNMEFLQDIAILLLGFLAKVAFDLASEPVFDRLRQYVVHKAKERYLIEKTPLPDVAFRTFRIGNIEIPAMPIVGSPETPFSPDEVHIHYEPTIHEERSTYPKELRAAREFLIDEIKKKHNVKQFVDNVLPRLDDVVQGPELENDKRGELEIFLSLTTYGSMIASNVALDYSIVPGSGTISKFLSNQTIRKAYCHPPYTDISKSVLANGPGVEVVVISRSDRQYPRDQLLIRRRSQNVTFYRGWYQVAASGHMSLEHRDAKGLPSPFVTAITEARQEIADRLILDPQQFRLMGVLLKWQDLHPAFHGYVETELTVEELLGDFKRDAYEGDLFAIPFDPYTVLSHMSKEKWFPISALAIVSTLLAFYSRRELEVIARRLPVKTARAFFLED